MTDHERLMVALLRSDDRELRDAVPTSDVVSMLYELGARYRAEARADAMLVAAS